jgi:hypothetical protein
MTEEVLNIPVSARLLRAWDNLFVSAVQPFYLPEDWPTLGWAAALASQPLWKRSELHSYHLPMAVHDTLNLYEVTPEAMWVLLLDEQGFADLPAGTQAGLLDAQLAFRRGGVEQAERLGPPRVWWPGSWQALPPEARWKRLKRFVEDDRLPCRRRELTSAHRRELRRRFPALMPMLGTFVPASGPNCLTSVMAAYGVPGTTNMWMHAPPFLRWLERAAVMSDSAETLHDVAQMGTVLVWRDAAGVVQHAALSLGEGWLFHKEAQGWFTPRQVVRLTDALGRWQHEGWSLSGYTLS